MAPVSCDKDEACILTLWAVVMGRLLVNGMRKSRTLASLFSFWLKAASVDALSGVEDYIEACLLCM